MAFYPLLPQFSLFYLRLIRRGSAYIFIFNQIAKMWTLLVGLYSAYAGSPTTRYDTKYSLVYLVISVLPYEYYYSLRLSLIPILPRLFHYISIMPTTYLAGSLTATGVYLGCGTSPPSPDKFPF